MPYFFNPNATGQLTPEEQEYFLQIPNITAKEEELLRRQRLADVLMLGSMGGPRMDWASQAARGLQGIGLGMMNYQNFQRDKALADQLRGIVQNYPRGRGIQDLLERYGRYWQIASMNNNYG